MSVEKIWLKAGVLAVVVIGVIVYWFSPKPIVSDTEDTWISMFLARNADETEGLYKFVENFDEQAILDVLHKAKQRQTLYNYQMNLSHQVDIDLIISVHEKEKSYEVHLGSESFVFYSGGDFKHWVLDQEQVLRDVAALIDPEELKGTVLEQK